MSFPLAKVHLVRRLLHRVLRRAWVLGVLVTVAMSAANANAFCGFFVNGASTSLYANATMVVLMHQGTRTVLSMQNNYQGPPNQFALVIPVPVVLQKEQVRTLPREVFGRIDQLGAPRLVEYWEHDPCAFNRGGPTITVCAACGGGSTSTDAVPPPTGTVKIEAQFVVGEYEVVLLSADDSSALASWLSSNQYNIPAGADAVLAPYVAAGSKFFVAKVDPAKVTFQNGQAALSPLRFYYDAVDFSLPVRLGLLNSGGTQDLIVNILAPSGQRYEVANYPNVVIPTNIRVRDEVRNNYAGFYEAMFERTVTAAARNPVVTEYSWDAQSCDPCPIPPLDATDLATLGADVLSGQSDAGGNIVPGVGSAYLGFTLTRLHYRYNASSLGEDLVFRAAGPLQGGRGVPDTRGMLDQTVSIQGAGYGNAFQGRYVILHPWEGDLDCTSPYRGDWGGPPADAGIMSMTMGLTNSALVGVTPAPADLASLVAENVSSVVVVATHPTDPLGPPREAGVGTTGGAITTGTSAGGNGGASGTATGGLVIGSTSTGGPPRGSSGGSTGSRDLAPSLVPGGPGNGCALGRGSPSSAGWALLASLAATIVARRDRRRRIA